MRRAWEERCATPAAILGLCVLSVTFFWRIVGLHQVLLPLDVLTVHDPLWRILGPNAGMLPRNGLDSDNLTEFYPWTALASDALRHHILPLWNPYAFSGTPFLGALQTAVLYPVNLVLEFFFAPIDVLGFRALTHSILTLTGTFVLARRFGLTRLAAMLAAVSFGLSLPYVVWLEHPMSGALAWTPWLLLSAEGSIAAAFAGRRLWSWTAAGAAVWALEFLAGHGESTLHIGLLVGAFVLFRSLALWRRSGRRPAALTLPLAAAAAALLLGIGLAAAQLLPSLATISVSEAALDRAAAATMDARTAVLGDPSAWSSLANAVIPDVNGSPTWQVRLAGAGSYNELASYVGAVPLILAGLALVRWRRSIRDAGMILFFAAAGATALGVAAHLPVFNIVNALPLFRVVANGRLRLEYAFCLALLAGYGLDMLRRSRDEAVDQVERAVVRLTWMLTVVSTIVAVVIAEVGIVTMVQGRQDGPKGVQVPGAPIDLALHAAVPFAWFLLFGLGVWAWRKGLAPASLVRWGALVLTAIDLFALGYGYHTTVSAAQAAVVPPAVRAAMSLERRDGVPSRVAGLGDSLLPSTSSLYGLQDIRGYDPAYSADYERFYGAAFALEGMRLKAAPFGPSPAEARAFDLLNVRYLFAACAIPLNQHYYTPVFSDGKAGCVYRNNTALARAYEVHSVSWTTPGRASLLLGSGTVDPRAQVLLDPATVADRAAWHVASSSSMVGDRVLVTHYDLDDVSLDVRSRGAGVVVLGDAYAPGWEATVDGQPTPLARADGILRAVSVTSGTHVVAFHYRPASFVVGAFISASALVLWLGLCLVAVWTWLRRLGAERRQSP